MSRRGESTRAEILDRATAMARVVGLGGLTIGQLASELQLSKSGLFAHFGSKEALEIAILDHTAESFVDHVVRPALAQPRGEPRLTAAFERWLEWGAFGRSDGGCVFVAASAELDDRPGPVRDCLVGHQRDWLDSLTQIVRSGQVDGQFRADVDPAQVAFELYGILLSTHHVVRLIGDPEGPHRARVAFAGLLSRIRVSGDPRGS
jgi:AcrR family transcriptional regulator